MFTSFIRLYRLIYLCDSEHHILQWNSDFGILFGDTQHCNLKTFIWIHQDSALPALPFLIKSLGLARKRKLLSTLQVLGASNREAERRHYNNSRHHPEPSQTRSAKLPLASQTNQLKQGGAPPARRVVEVETALVIDPSVGSRARQDWGAAASLCPNQPWVPAPIAASRCRVGGGRERETGEGEVEKTGSGARGRALVRHGPECRVLPRRAPPLRRRNRPPPPPSLLAGYARGPIV